MNISVYWDLTFFLRSVQVMRKKLLLSFFESERSQILFFSRFFFLFLGLSELLKSLHKRLGPLFTYIMNNLPFWVLSWAYMIAFTFSTIPLTFVKHDIRQRISISLRNSQCFASQLVKRFLISRVPRLGVKRIGGTYSQTVEPCTRVRVTLVPTHYLPNCHTSWFIEVFSPCSSEGFYSLFHISQDLRLLTVILPSSFSFH